jgi:homoserine kinase type II
MGVATEITLQEVQKLFPTFNISQLHKTSDGVMDTTYILDRYILKKYERDIKTKLIQEIAVLDKLQKNKLNVSSHIAHKGGWHLYKKLDGDKPKTIHYHHIQQLARFMAKMHKVDLKDVKLSSFNDAYNLNEILDFTKKNFFYTYKKLQTLYNYKMKNDGFIHGDIFKDNTLFYKNNIAVIDFIDSGYGEFAFDVAVSLIAFNPKQKKSINKVFLQTYNQYAPKKIDQKQLYMQISKASKFYALLRVEKYKNTIKAKELLQF